MPRSLLALAAATLLIVLTALFALGDRPLPPAAATLLTATTSPAVTSATTTPATTTPTSSRGPIPDGYRVLIPRLGIDLAIAEGDEQRDSQLQQTPENFAFHFPGTGLPGAGSNSYLYAHARRGMFLSLWNARVGDEVLITTPDGRSLRYIVSEVHPRVPPTDVSWLEPTSGERLTLQTSTGPNAGDPRFVVIALPA
jgi:sortase (surface protein transpeptidase)